ncbi:hypothetical protein ACFLQW_00400 [Candidatus Zixiibacteriota bacterium]
MTAMEKTTDLSKTHYAVAGWLAIAQAVLVLPQIALAVFVEILSESFPVANVFLVMMKITGLAVGVYVLYMFKHLLNDRYGFHKTDILILILIGANAFFFTLGIIGLIPSLEIAVGIATIVLLVPFSVLEIIFGVLLLKLEDNLFGLKRPFAYLTIAGGVCGVTVILMPFYFLAGLVSLVIQGMIFLRAKEDMEFL